VTPQVLDSVTDIEVIVFYNVDALDARWVAGVVGWMVNQIRHESPAAHE
jgi:hypothetical protein